MQEQAGVRARVKITLRKFAGEFEPGKEPHDVIEHEFEEELSDAAHQRLQELLGPGRLG